MKLGPTEIDGLAGCICGGDGTSQPYRTGTNIDRFRGFVGARVSWMPGGSRFYDSQSYLEACNETAPGATGLPSAIEKVITGLVDRRHFDRDDAQDDAIAEVTRILDFHQVRFVVGPRREVELVAAQTPGQEVIDAEIHTAFESVLRESDLASAREHYRKARRFLRSAEPDYANAAKEAVCAVEAMLLALTQERDFNRAVERAVRTGDVPRPLGEMMKKLYAYRGDEAGVAHADVKAPDVDRAEAEFAVNQAAVTGLYLRAKLLRPAP